MAKEFGAKIKISVDTSRDAQTKLREEIQAAIDRATSKSKTTVKIREFTIDKEAKNKLKEDVGKIGVNIKVKKINASDAIKNLRKDIEKMLSGLTVGGVGAFLKETSGKDPNSGSAKEAQKKLGEAIEDTTAKLAQQKAMTEELKRVQSTLTSSYTAISKLDPTVSNDLLTRYEELNQATQKLRVNEKERNQEAVRYLSVEAAKLRQLATARRENIQVLEVQYATAQQLKTLESQITRMQLANTKAKGTYGKNLSGFLEEINAGKMTVKRLREIQAAVKGVDTNMRQANLTGHTFWNTMKKGWEKFGGWSLVTGSMTKAFQAIKQGVNNVIALDDAMTELKKVTDLTEASYAKFGRTAAAMAKDVGAKISDTITATADYSRLGYGIEDASALAEASLIYKNVGDGIEDITEASESIISTMKAFKIEAADAMSIVDKFNEVGNKFAISSVGIGTALQKSASALAVGGNSLEESIALITAMNNVLQNPETVGTATKTLSMYLRAAKADLEEAGESTEGMANSVSELRGQLLALTNNRLDIMIDDSTFKSTYEVMKDLAAIWEDINDIDQAAILELIGGKRNANAVTSLLTNFADAENSLEVAMNAAGSATRENETYLDSITGKITVLKASLEELSDVAINNSLLKFILDLLTGVVNLTSLLGKVNMLLPVTLSVIAAISNRISKAKAADTAKKLGDMANQLSASKGNVYDYRIEVLALSDAEKQQLKQILENKIGMKEYTESIHEQTLEILGLSEAIDRVNNSSKSLNNTLNSSNLDVGDNNKQDISDAIDDAAEDAVKVQVISEASEAIVENTAKTASGLGKIGAKISGIWSGLSTVSKFSVVLSILGAAVGIGKLLVDGLIKARQEAIDTANEIIDRFGKAKKTFESNKETLESLREEFEILSLGADRDGKNINLTTEEYERYKGIIEQIKDISPDIVLGYNAEGKAVLNYATALDEAIKKQEEYIANEERIYLGRGEDVFNGKKNEYEDTLNDFAKIVGFIGGPKDSIRDLFTANLLDINETIPEVNKRVAAFEKALSEIGVDIGQRITSDIGLVGGYDKKQELILIFEKSEQFLRSIKDSGALTDEALIKLEQRINELAEPYSKLFEIQNEQAEYAKRWAKSQDWYQFIPEEALNGFANSLNRIVDPLAKYTDNMLLAEELGKALANEFNQFRSSDWGQSLERSVKQFAEGAISAEDLEYKLQLLNDSYSGNADVLAILIDYYKKLADVEREAVLAAQFTHPLDFSGLKSQLDGVLKGFDNIISAMAQLNSGTLLTKQTLASLAMEFPKLLEQEGLFADNTIADQQRILDAVLSSVEAEHDAKIEAKISELQTSQKMIMEQMKVEEAKAKALLEIEESVTDGRVISEAALVNKFAEYNDLLGKNYATMENGILKTQRDAAEVKLKQENEVTTTAVRDIWEPYANAIRVAHSEAYNKSVESLTEYGDNLWQTLSGIAETILPEYQNSIQQALNYGKDNPLGDISGFFDKPDDWIKNSILGSIGNTREHISIDAGRELDPNYITLDFTGATGLTIDGKSVDDWISEQEKAISQRTADLTSAYESMQNAIDNLMRMKGLDLADLYGSGSSKDSSVEKYIADIDEFYKALKRLEAAQKLVADIEFRIENTDDYRERIELRRQLIAGYEKEIAAEKNLRDEKTKAVQNNIELLRKEGFEIRYNAETNDLYIANKEKLQDIVAKEQGQYDSITAASNAYRKEIEELIKVTEELNDDNEEAVDRINDISNSIKNANEEILDDIQEIVDAAKNAFSEIADVYDTLKSAAESYNKNGFLSVDIFESILSLSPKYLEFLKDENGEIRFNEQAIKDLTAARLEDLAITKAMSIIDLVKENIDNAEALREMADASYEAADAQWSLVYAELAALNISPELKDKFLQQINMIRELADSAKLSIGLVENKVSDYYNDASDALEYILDKTMELIKHEQEEHTKVLEDQIEKYQEIIDLKKEALETAKEENDYEKDLAEKYKEIAELQMRIDQLSLDDSREAQAERNSLLKELAEKQGDLADTQEEHAYDAQVDALDKLADSYEKEKQQEIKTLEDSLMSQEQLYQAALQRLESNWVLLYRDLIAWNTEFGNTINSEITENWHKAISAVSKYGSYASAVANIKNYIESENFGTTISGQNYWSIPQFHTGGVVTGERDKQEVLARLQDGEVVLNDKKQESLYELIDFNDYLGKKLGISIGNLDIPEPTHPITSNIGMSPMSHITNNNSTMDFSPSISVTVQAGDLGGNEPSKIGTEIANITIDKMYEAFERRGMGFRGKAILKPN